MLSWPALPAATLKNTGTVSTEFLVRGLADYRSAGAYLQRLPYGRNIDRANARLVLSEGRGTCSTKHALLAELAYEQQLPLALTLGIYAMDERNTPGVGRVLDLYGLPFIPEAHCYLTYQGERIDITRSGVEPAEPITQFLAEETIAPEQIGDYKVQWHQRFLREWVVRAAGVGRRSFEEIWAIREACIAALNQNV